MAYIGNKPTVGNFQICDAISVVNGQAAYTMQVGSVNVIPQSANHMIVSLNGTIQKPNSSFTVSGSTITFASNLATGDVIDFIQILGDVLDLGVPSDATVTSAKLATLTSAMNFQGTASDMRLNFDTTDTVANATPLMAITAKNKTDSVAQLSMRRESAVDDGYIALSTQPTGGAVTERVRIHSNGVMSAANGIALGVGTANTASNVLDDYEEGTFTPTWTSNVTVSVASGNYGYYTKIGDMVTVHFGAVLNASSPSYYAISNAPFQSNIATGNAIGSGREYGQTGTVQSVYMGDNSTSIGVKKYDNTGISNSYLSASITYRTD